MQIYSKSMKKCYFVISWPILILFVFVSPERMFVGTHSDPNSVCPYVRSSVRPSVKVSVNLFQIAPVRTGSLQL